MLSAAALNAIEEHLAELSTEPALILEDAYLLLAEVRELHSGEIALIRSALGIMRDERQLSFDELPGPTDS